MESTKGRMDDANSGNDICSLSSKKANTSKYKYYGETDGDGADTPSRITRTTTLW